jgi:mRNA interferase MazF
MVIRQGDIFWCDMGSPAGSEPGYRRPCVVVSSDDYNGSRIATVVVCFLTTNVLRALDSGNVMLHRGEGGLPKASIVNVTQIHTVNRTDLCERLGRLEPDRMLEVVSGIVRLVTPALH